LDREFERLISAHLRRRHGSADRKVSTDDLTLLVEEHVDDLDLYADLSAFGLGVEGVTAFRPGARPKVLIDTALAEQEKRENRLRTTLAHEFGHVHLHRYIIDLAIDEGRIDRQRAAKIVCKRDTILSAPKVDWREWQAGYACGAILMPAQRLKQLVADWKSIESFETVGGAAEALVNHVATYFQVSRQAASVRLSVLGLAL
jgi:hypothetical protein